jgi:hypothetical protein
MWCIAPMELLRTVSKGRVGKLGPNVVHSSYGTTNSLGRESRKDWVGLKQNQFQEQK